MKIKRLFFLALAWVSLGLGTAGIFLPVLPTVPLYLLTVLGFAKGSVRLHDWFLKTSLYKKHLEGYAKAGGLPAKAKSSIIAFVTAELAIVFLLVPSTVARIIIAAGWLGHLVCMLCVVKTIPPLE